MSGVALFKLSTLPAKCNFATFPSSSSQLHFCLKVKDNSMADDHLCEGDFLIVKNQNHCNEGKVVVALVDGQVTVKHYVQEAKRVRLKSTNGKSIYAKNVEILGVVVGVIRRC